MSAHLPEKDTLLILCMTIIIYLIMMKFESSLRPSLLGGDFAILLSMKYCALSFAAE